MCVCSAGSGGVGVVVTLALGGPDEGGARLAADFLQGLINVLLDAASDLDYNITADGDPERYGEKSIVFSCSVSGRLNFFP